MSTQLAQIDQQEIQILENLKKRAESIVVHNQTEYIEICQVLIDARTRIKQVERRWDTAIDIKKRELDDLRNEKKKELLLPEAIASVASTKAAEFKAEERRLALAEEKRINDEKLAEALRKSQEEQKIANAKAAEERAERERQAKIIREEQEREAERARKAGEIGKREEARLKKVAEEEAEQSRKDAAASELRSKALAAEQAKQTATNVQTVRVAPSVPKVSGVRARVNPKWRMIHVDLIPRIYLYPNDINATENYPRITVEVRKGRDGESFVDRKARLEREIPGIEFYEEDAV